MKKISDLMLTPLEKGFELYMTWQSNREAATFQPEELATISQYNVLCHGFAYAAQHYVSAGVPQESVQEYYAMTRNLPPDEISSIRFPTRPNNPEKFLTKQEQARVNWIILEGGFCNPEKPGLTESQKLQRESLSQLNQIRTRDIWLEAAARHAGGLHKLAGIVPGDLVTAESRKFFERRKVKTISALTHFILD